MTKEDFKSFLIKLGVYYNLNLQVTINDDRFNMWYAKVKGISLESLDYIRNTIQDQKNAFPINLPKLMAEIYEIYNKTRRIDPQPKQQSIIKECPDCGGTGIFIAYVLGDRSLRYEKRIFACANCQNWKQHFNSLIFIINNQEIRIEMVFKKELLCRNFVAGIDGDMETVLKVRELNRLMSEKNTKTVGFKYD